MLHGATYVFFTHTHTRSHPHIHLSELLIVKMNNETHLEQRQLKLLQAASLHLSAISSPLVHMRSTHIHLAKLHPLPLMMLPSLMIKRKILTRFIIIFFFNFDKNLIFIAFLTVKYVKKI